MALPEETEIMREIGLGQHYNWHNGSGGCRGTRVEVVKKLPEVLANHGCLVDHDLIAMLRRVAQHGEESDYVLTKTWQAASDVIQTHLMGRDHPEGFAMRKGAVLAHHDIGTIGPRGTGVAFDFAGRMVNYPWMG